MSDPKDKASPATQPANEGSIAFHRALGFELTGEPIDGETYPMVRDFGGHGIGRAMHMPPHVPHTGRRGRGLRLRAGMTLTIEPGIYIPRDDTTNHVPARFRGIGIRIEDDVLITSSGCEVLSDGVAKEATQIEALMAS